MGRHKNINCFYLCQRRPKKPTNLIRDNGNMIMIFEQDNMNLRHIYNDHVIDDISLNQFVGICNRYWRDKYRFLVVSKDDELNKLRYRKGFDNFIHL